MKSLTIDFILDPLKEGQYPSRCQHLSHIDAKILLERMAAAEFHSISGGFCMVVDGMVWNTLNPQPYDSAGVDALVDGVDDALIFLECVTGQAEDNTPLQCYFTEMIVVKLDPDKNAMLSIRLEGVAHPLTIGSIQVSARGFYGSLCKASHDFITFAHMLLALLRSRDIPLSEDARQNFEARLRLAEWERTATRLSEVMHRY